MEQSRQSHGLVSGETGWVTQRGGSSAATTTPQRSDHVDGQQSPCARDGSVASVFAFSPNAASHEHH